MIFSSWSSFCCSASGISSRSSFGTSPVVSVAIIPNGLSGAGIAGAWDRASAFAFLFPGL